VSGNPASGAKTAILVVDASNRVHPQAVTLGTVADSTVEVAGGLAEGQVVVIGTTAGLSDGDTVTPLPTASAGTGATS